MAWRRVTLLPVPLRPSRQNAVARGISNDTSSSTRRSPNDLVTRFEADGGIGHLDYAVSGKSKTISRTSTTLTTISTTDDMTTLRVEARPTPSVPWLVVIRERTTRWR